MVFLEKAGEKSELRLKDLGILFKFGMFLV